MSDTKISPIKKLLWSSSSIVWLSAMLVAAAMILQGFASGFENGIILPHQALAWSFAVIASGYAGTDRIAQFVKTQALEYGTVDMGDPAKLRKLILITVLLLSLGVALTSFFGIPGLALDALAAAFGGTGAAYVIGNKSLRAAASKEGNHTTEQFQFHVEGEYDAAGK
jgi:hypothetical protein